MLDLEHVTIYTWDARPYPAFPQYQSVWSDAGNWPTGQWIAGKFSTYSLPSQGNSMALANTYAPVSPYITDPATGQISKQWADFFQSIQFIQQPAIANVPIDAQTSDVVNAVNNLLAALRAMNRIST